MRETDSVFGFYFILFLHTVGLALLVGSNTVVDLRLLGMGREIPHRSAEAFLQHHVAGILAKRDNRRVASVGVSDKGAYEPGLSISN